MTKPRIDVFDNEGKTFDRYTVIIERGTLSKFTVEYYGMSINPKSPQGFNQYLGDDNYLPNLLKSESIGKLVPVKTLPQEVQDAIKERI